MKNFFYGGLIAASLVFASATPAKAELQSDPERDADCTISLMLLMAQVEEAGGEQDPIFTITMYYFGRLGGEWRANEAYLTSRMDRFVAEPEFYLEKSQQCATDFEAEAETLGEFGTSLAK
jgi:hypothetical protein